MTWTLLNSKAYKALKPSSAKALPFFLGKKYKSIGGEFTFSYSEANRLGFAPATFSNVIRDVISKGFFDPVDKGGLRGVGKSFNKYKFSYRWEKYGETDFIKIEWNTFEPKLNK